MQCPDRMAATLCSILGETVQQCSEGKKAFQAKPKLQVWSPEIKACLHRMRNAYREWSSCGKAIQNHNPMLQVKQETKKCF